MEASAMKSLRFGAVYGAPPIFNPDVDEMGYIELTKLHISPYLLMQLEEWNAAFQQTFFEDYPPDSGFKSEEDRDLHNKWGVILTTLLQRELGASVQIEFRPLNEHIRQCR
jgi:hypothetical protein